MKNRYKILIISIGVLVFAGWTVTEGSLSWHPTMMCYEIFDCTPINNPDFLGCINSNVYGRTVMNYCADPNLVEAENGCVSVKMPWDNTIVKCSDR